MISPSVCKDLGGGGSFKVKLSEGEGLGGLKAKGLEGRGGWKAEGWGSDVLAGGGLKSKIFVLTVGGLKSKILELLVVGGLVVGGLMVSGLTVGGLMVGGLKSKTLAVVGSLAAGGL